MKIKRWEEYKVFFQITIFRYLVLWFSVVPIIAGIFEQIPFGFSLPFHWQLLWLSSFFFMISLAIYKLKCPGFIHKYNKYSDYQNYSHHSRWLAWEVQTLVKEISEKQKEKFVTRLLTKKYLTEVPSVSDAWLNEPQIEEKQTACYFKLENQIYRLGMPILIDGKVPEDSEKDLFYEVFGRYSELREGFRRTILIFLIVSLVLFLIVLVQHIIVGGGYAIEWLYGFL